MVLVFERNSRARRDYQCSICHQTIAKGSFYTSKTFRDDDGELDARKECEACTDIVDDFIDDGGDMDDYCDDDIAEWWQENRCDECIHDCAGKMRQYSRCDEYVIKE